MSANDPEDKLYTAKALVEACRTRDAKKQIRRGWRKFVCECGHEFELATRDCFSPSGESCLKCCEWVHPSEHRIDAGLACDTMGNLIEKT